jgi:hypothetical protein
MFNFKRKFQEMGRNRKEGATHREEKKLIGNRGPGINYRQEVVRCLHRLFSIEMGGIN